MLGKAREIADFLKQEPEVDYTYVTVGGGFRGTPNQGSVNVQLKSASERDRTMTEIQGDVRNKLSTALGRLMVVAEAYPQLKADQNFLKLQDELTGTENRIAVARTDYNNAVQAYNTYIRIQGGDK